MQTIHTRTHTCTLNTNAYVYTILTYTRAKAACTHTRTTQGVRVIVFFKFNRRELGAGQRGPSRQRRRNGIQLHFIHIPARRRCRCLRLVHLDLDTALRHELRYHHVAEHCLGRRHVAALRDTVHGCCVCVSYSVHGPPPCLYTHA